MMQADLSNFFRTALMLPILFVLLLESLLLGIFALNCANQWSRNETAHSSAVITFLIPTSGRQALPRILNSLVEQSNPNWLAIVYFDGITTSNWYLSGETQIPFFLRQDYVVLNDHRVCYQNHLEGSAYDHTKRIKKGDGCNIGSEAVRELGMRMCTTPLVNIIDEENSSTVEYAHYIQGVVDKLKETGTVKNSEQVVLCGQSGNTTAVKHYNYKPVVDATADDSTKMGQVAFKFTEERSPFFANNVNGLRSALLRAVGKGCVKNLNLHQNISIHFMFNAGTKKDLTSDYFIQLQLEQRGSFHFSDTYKTKLNEALQVWEFSPSALLHDKQQHQPVYNSPKFYIPTALLLPTNPVFQCNSQSKPFSSSSSSGRRSGGDSGGRSGSMAVSNENIVREKLNTDYIGSELPNKGNSSSNSYSTTSYNNNNNNFSISNAPHRMLTIKGHATKFEYYRSGFYRTCVIGRDGLVTSSKIIKSPSCALVPDRKAGKADSSTDHRQEQCLANSDIAINKDDNECQRIVSSITDEDPEHNSSIILMYGKLRGSYGERRERLCDYMRGVVGSLGGNTEDVLCLEGIFGFWLERFVCKASIIVVEHYFKESALETHRIDPLLQAGKAVIVTPSSDKQLEHLYKHHVSIAERSHIAHRLKSLVSAQKSSACAISRPKEDEGNNIEGKRNDTSPGMHGVRQNQELKKFINALTTTLDPLCYALGSLGESIGMKKTKVPTIGYSKS